jgi:hypothetical protein
MDQPVGKNPVDINFFSCMEIRIYFHLLCSYMQTKPSSTDPSNHTPKEYNDIKIFSFPMVDLFQGGPIY